jgi:hypothetical protein
MQELAFSTSLIYEVEERFSILRDALEWEWRVGGLEEKMPIQNVIAEFSVFFLH